MSLKIVLVIIFQWFVSMVLFSQDSTKKYWYFKDDSVVFKKLNITFEIGFQHPKYRQLVQSVMNLPVDEGFDDYQLYKSTRISFVNRRRYHFNLDVNVKLFPKLYATLGMKIKTYHSNITIMSDSLFNKNQEEVWYAHSTKDGFLFQMPFMLQYRINKYFYPFLGYSFNVLEMAKANLYDSQGRQSSTTLNRNLIAKHNELIAGFDFNIPKTKRTYFTFKFIHTGKSKNLKDKDLWYSFGLKYYLL